MDDHGGTKSNESVNGRQRLSYTLRVLKGVMGWRNAALNLLLMAGGSAKAELPPPRIEMSEASKIPHVARRGHGLLKDVRIMPSAQARARKRRHLYMHAAARHRIGLAQAG